MMSFSTQVRWLSFFGLLLFGVGSSFPVLAAESKIVISEPSFVREDSGLYLLSAKIENTDWNSTLPVYPFLKYTPTDPSRGSSFIVPLGTGTTLSRAESFALKSTITLPRPVFGTTEVTLGLADELGAVIQETPLAEVTGGNGQSFLNLGNCKYSTYPLLPDSHFILLVGKDPDVVSCLIGNGTANTAKLHLHLDVYSYEPYGKKIGESDLPLELAAGQTTEKEISLPENFGDVAGNHSIILSLTTDERTLASIPTAWKLDVTGSAAALTTLRLDKTAYKAGGTATLEYAGSVRPASWDKLDAYTLKVSLTNNQNEVCAEMTDPVPFDATEGIKTVNISVTKNCNEPTAHVTLLDGSKTPVLQQSVSTVLRKDLVKVSPIRQFFARFTFFIPILLGIVAVGLILGFVWFWKQRQKRSQVSDELQSPPSPTDTLN